MVGGQTSCWCLELPPPCGEVVLIFPKQMNDETKRQQQLDREATSLEAGYAKFIKNQKRMAVEANGSNTMFAVWVKKQLLPDVVEEMMSALNDLRNTRASLARKVIEECLMGGKSSGDFETHGFWDVNEAAFAGFQLTLDCALNPNTIDHTVPGRFGGDKKLLAKKTIPELEDYIGNILNQQIGLKIVKHLFPEWYRIADMDAQKTHEDGMRSTTSYWEYRMRKAINKKIAKCREEGDDIAADILQNRHRWDYTQRRIVGAWILRAVIKSTDCFEEYSKWVDGKTVKYLKLSEVAETKREQLHDFAKAYSVELLPMLVEPEPVSNLTLGGWLSDCLQMPESSNRGEIELSDRHLEFLNRQAKVAFQINPFTHQLLERLVKDEKPLGKFSYKKLLDLPSIPSMLGYGHITDLAEQDRLVRSDKDKFKAAKRAWSDIKNKNLKLLQESLLAHHVVDKSKKLLDDEQFYIPMKFDFRGRIYSRVPFISFQSNDCGRYLIRFAEKTPIDKRTEHWFKVGISNAGGNDKLCWDKRIHWFDKNVEEIINVGRMMDGGDFSRAYDFLTQDCIDDPFCLAALANEYVKVFVDKTQDYTQCYVCVDASCSGTSIFNSWRLNASGGKLVNLIDADKPQDIYMAVWEEIKSRAKTFDDDFLKRLEASKLLRKMMKTTYVPASYASPVQEQLRKLKQFNKKLIKAGIGFNEIQMQELLNLWEDCLDEVSSISTVVKWFQSRTKEALDNGANEIQYTSCNGSKMTLKYPKMKSKRIKLPSRGSALLTQGSVSETLPEVNRKKLVTAVTSNITHLTDAAALCEALWDCEIPFVGIHDACGLPIGQAIDDGIARLKQGLIDATRHNVWDTFRTDNNLPLDDQTTGPVIGDLNLNDIKKSNYIYS